MTETQPTVFIRDIPPALKRALVRAAKERGSNVTAIVTEALAQEFGVPVQVKHRTANASDRTITRINPRVPWRLKSAIRSAVFERGEMEGRRIAESDVAKIALARHFGVALRVGDINRGRGKRRTRAAA